MYSKRYTNISSAFFPLSLFSSNFANFGVQLFVFGLYHSALLSLSSIAIALFSRARNLNSISEHPTPDNCHEISSIGRGNREHERPLYRRFQMHLPIRITVLVRFVLSRYFVLLFLLQIQALNCAQLNRITRES